MNRHPSSPHEPPEEPGDYMVQGHVGDCWRKLRWTGDGFYAPGWNHKQRWYRWKPLQECRP